MERRTKRTVIIDIEANSLFPTVIWCIVCKDIETNEIFKFRPKNPYTGHVDWKDEFISFIEEVETFIGHNLLGYDIFHINRLLGTDIKIGQVKDTLVMSRLFRPVSPFKSDLGKLKTDTRLGGHSLGAWGNRLKFPKIDFNKWDVFTEEMLEYCVMDVEVNHKVYDQLVIEGKGFSSYSIRLEHKVAWLLAQQERNGFYLDQEACTQLLKETTELLDEMTEKLQDIFPPVPKLIRTYETKYNKDGSIGAVSNRILKSYKNDPEKTIKEISKDTYELYIYEEFNPKSSQQIAKRLLSIGWEPRKYTDKGNPATDKDTLGGAIADLLDINPELYELKYLGNYNIVADRQQKAAKWLELVEDDGRVHGRINPIGAGTHRCAHYHDNMANIASVTTSKGDKSSFGDVDFQGMPQFTRFDGNKIFLSQEGDNIEFALTGLEGKFGWDSRACWSAADDEHCIVGADASGIQLRALAHYMNDPEYTRQLLEEDIHTVNRIAAGIDTRPRAKTFIYAWLLGAGDEKVGSIVGVTESEYKDLFAFARKRSVWGKPMLNYIMGSLRKKGRKATERLVATIIKGFKVKEQFLNRTPALKRLKTEEIPIATKQGYVEGIDGRRLWIPNEHLAMSLYLQGFEAVAMKLATCIYHDTLREKNIPFKQVAFVHDEWQIETLWKHADDVGRACVDALKQAGATLGSNCPLDGEYKIGLNWARTH